MAMSDFHWRSAVMSAVQNMPLLIRTGVMKSWFVVMKDGDLFLRDGKILRCDGVARLRGGSNAVRWSRVGGDRSEGSFLVSDSDRVEKLDIIGYSDVIRFLNGTQPQFIADVETAYRGFLPRLSGAERERQRRAKETPEQAEERRRKNRENMRRRRAQNKGLI